VEIENKETEKSKKLRNIETASGGKKKKYQFYRAEENTGTVEKSLSRKGNAAHYQLTESHARVPPKLWEERGGRERNGEKGREFLGNRAITTPSSLLLGKGGRITTTKGKRLIMRKG